MKRTAVWVVVILAGIIIVLSYLFFTIPKPSTPPASTTNTQPVTYTCSDSKSITAQYATSSVTIMLSDGRTLTLPQAVSASGIRYESGAQTANDVVFWSEGNNAFLTENGQSTYTNCVAGTTTTQNQTSTFTDQGHTFSFSYPSMFSVSGSNAGYTQSWMYDATTTGLILAQLQIPASFEPKTNFAGATLTVGTSPDSQAVAQCLTYPNFGNAETRTTVTIHGITYSKLTYSDAGAGNFYDITSYRTVRNNQCYAIEYVIHSADIGNFSPDQGITAFNETSIENILSGIAQSFQFL